MPFLLGLGGLAVKWKSIGAHLGVPDGELDAIQQNNNANGHVDMCRDCLRDMFHWWLDNGDDVTAKKLASLAGQTLLRKNRERVWSKAYTARVPTSYVTSIFPLCVI